MMARALQDQPVTVEETVAAEPARAEATPAPPRLRRILPRLAGLTLAAAVPPLLLDSVWNATFALALIFGLMGLSMVVLTGYVGQLSLMPATFVGVGAFTSAGLVSRLDTPFWGAVPLAAALTGPMALVIGIVALRLKGLYLAIMTLVFADVVQEFLFKQQWFTGEGGAAEAPRPTLGGIDFSSDSAFYLLTLAVAVIALVLVGNFSRTRSARACYAVRDNEAAAQALGINVAKYKLLAFAMHGFIAGLAGALYGHWLESVSAGGQRPLFGLEFSLVIVFFTILGGVRSIWGPMLGATIWVVLVQRLLADSPNGQNIAFSIVAMLVLATMIYRPAGLVGWIGDGARALRGRVAR